MSVTSKREAANVVSDVKVDIEDLDMTDHQVFVLGGEPFDGVAVEYARDGRVLSETSLTSGIKDGWLR